MRRHFCEKDVDAATADVRAVCGLASAQRPIDDDRGRVARLHDAPDLREVAVVGLPMRGGEARDLLASPHVHAGVMR